MADFPTAVTTNVDPLSGSLVTNPGHAAQHQSHNAEIKATQTKIGTGASTPTSGKVLRASGTGTSAWAQVDPSTDVTTLTSATLRGLLTDETGTGAAVFGTSPTITTPTLTTPTITAPSITTPTITTGGTWTGSPSITTPKVITSINDANGNEVIQTPATASAVNEITVTNAAAAGSPTISATGGDTNIDLTFAAKGTGKLKGVVNNLFNPYKFSAYRSTNQTVTTGVDTKIQFDTKNFDTGSNYDNATNYRFTAPIAGFYWFTANAANNGNGVFSIYFYKNGSAARAGDGLNPATALSGGGVNELLQLAAADYVEVFVNSVNTTITFGGATLRNTYFSGFLVSAT